MRSARYYWLSAIGAASILLVSACGSDKTPTETGGVAGVTVNAPSSSIAAATTSQLTAVVTDANGKPLNGQTVTWSTSDSTIAAISSSGLVTALGTGTADITATSGSVSGQAHLTITPRTDTIQLTTPSTVGQTHFPAGNTSAGGQGSAVDGVGCDAGFPEAPHPHAQLTIYQNGTQLAVPIAIGIKDPFIVNDNGNDAAIAGSCFYWLHTHDASGILHVEAPNAGPFTLGQFFDIWGEPLSNGNVAGLTGNMTIYVDGAPYTGDPRAITITSHKLITIEVGSPIVAPPAYKFPSGL
jgi:hypothetical protein